MDKKELFLILGEANINVDNLTERLMGNTKLITKFLQRFPEDKSYLCLMDALEKGQCEEAFRAAHSLKGVCSNLSMTGLYKVVSIQVEALRSGDLQRGREMMPAVTEEYKKMVDMINGIDWEQ